QERLDRAIRGGFAEVDAVAGGGLVAAAERGDDALADGHGVAQAGRHAVAVGVVEGAVEHQLGEQPGRRLGGGGRFFEELALDVVAHGVTRGEWGLTVPHSTLTVKGWVMPCRLTESRRREVGIELPTLTGIVRQVRL